MAFKLFLESYKLSLRNLGLRVSPYFWFSFALIFGSAFFVLSFYIFENLIISSVIFIAVTDLLIGFPIYKEQTRINAIEKFLPTALREMADILKSGGTYEYALKEMSTLDYGPLNMELEKVLIRLEEGSNFEESLRSLSEIDSDLVRKVVNIIIDSVRAGAGLADVLEEIADDAREIYKLEQDRVAKTTMQVLFIFLAGSIIAPAIFGLVRTIVSFLIEVASSTGVAKPQDIFNANVANQTIENVLLIYIFFESLASSLMITMMRDKSAVKVVLYLPIFLLLAYSTYFIASLLTQSLLTGMI